MESGIVRRNNLTTSITVIAFVGLGLTIIAFAGYGEWLRAKADSRQILALRSMYDRPSAAPRQPCELRADDYWYCE